MYNRAYIPSNRKPKYYYIYYLLSGTLLNKKPGT
jgi:hypothetical protein